LTGVLPEPWLPLKKGQTLVNSEGRARGGRGARGRGDEDEGQFGDAVVLTLRKRYSGVRGGVGTGAGGVGGGAATTNGAGAGGVGVGPRSRSGTRSVRHRLSFDHASGVIMLPEGIEDVSEEEEEEEVMPVGVGEEEEEEEEEEGAYWHHPERVRSRRESRV